MLDYYKQEIRDLRNTESRKVREVYKIVKGKGDTAEHFVKHLAEHTSWGEGVIKGVLTDLVACLDERLAEAGSVTLPGIGTFSVSIRPKQGREKGLIDKGDMTTATGQGLGTDEEQAAASEAGDEENHELNAQSLEVSHITFSCDKRLLGSVRARLRGKGQLRQSPYMGFVPLYQPKEAHRLDRFASARAYLEEHHFMRVADYAELTGLSYSVAQRELKLAAHLDHSGIIAQGRGSHRIYVLASEKKD